MREEDGYYYYISFGVCSPVADASIYRLRTAGPVSFLRLYFFSAYIVERPSSFVTGFVRFSYPNALGEEDGVCEWGARKRVRRSDNGGDT